MLPLFLQGWLATLLCVLAIPLLLLRKKTRRGMRQRLGNVPPVTSENGPRVWVHAASAGDVKNVWPVVRALKEAKPNTVVMLTCVTNSAEEMVKSLSLPPPPDVAPYVPLDAPPFVQPALDAWKPQLLLLEMTELWPTLVRLTHARNVPVTLCNGRMSEFSSRRYAVLFKFMENPIRLLSRACMQTGADLQRTSNWGQPPSGVWFQHTGQTTVRPRAQAPPELAA